MMTSVFFIIRPKPSAQIICLWPDYGGPNGEFLRQPGDQHRRSRGLEQVCKQVKSLTPLAFKDLGLLKMQKKEVISSTKAPCRSFF